MTFSFVSNCSASLEWKNWTGLHKALTFIPYKTWGIHLQAHSEPEARFTKAICEHCLNTAESDNILFHKWLSLTKWHIYLQVIKGLHVHVWALSIEHILSSRTSKWMGLELISCCKLQLVYCQNEPKNSANNSFGPHQCSCGWKGANPCSQVPACCGKLGTRRVEAVIVAD